MRALSHKVGIPFVVPFWRRTLTSLRDHLDHRPEDPMAWLTRIRVRILSFLIDRYGGGETIEPPVVSDTRSAPTFYKYEGQQQISDPNAGKSPRKSGEIRASLGVITDENQLRTSAIEEQIQFHRNVAGNRQRVIMEMHRVFMAGRWPSSEELELWNVSFSFVYGCFSFWHDIAKKTKCTPPAPSFDLIRSEVKWAPEEIDRELDHILREVGMIKPDDPPAGGSTDDTRPSP